MGVFPGSGQFEAFVQNLEDRARIAQAENARKAKTESLFWNEIKKNTRRN